MVSHHPTPEWLASYVAGSLSMSYSLAVAAHIDYCPLCKANAQRLERLGAVLVEKIKPKQVSSALKNKVFAAIADDSRTRHEDKKPLNVTSSATPSLRRLVPKNYESLGWRSLTPAIKSVCLTKDRAGDQVSLMKLMPGARVADHRHSGEEITVVLEGSFSDQSGMYQRGDFLLRDARHHHQPVASNDRQCICLTVQDGPIQFTGVWARMLNPFLKQAYQ